MFRLFAVALISNLAFALTSNAQFKYPAARREPFDTIIHGKKISDDFFWMSRNENAEEVQEFSRQQGGLTQAILDSIPGTEMITKEWDEAMDAIKRTAAAFRMVVPLVFQFLNGAIKSSRLFNEEDKYAHFNSSMVQLKECLKCF